MSKRNMFLITEPNIGIFFGGAILSISKLTKTLAIKSC